MDTEVLLVVRPLAATTGLVSQIPATPLVEYFGALGVDLRLSAGNVLTEDPTDHPDEVQQFCRSVAPRPPNALPWPGSLVIGEMSVDGPGTNGILLDLNSRGACAVFTNADAFSLGSRDTRFEIFAHEIGHMLNLVHSEADDQFPTAMNQWLVRSSVKNRKAVWQAAISGGSDLQRLRLPVFFRNGSRQPIGLPMSARCCHWLTNPNRVDIIPWGSRFKDSTGSGPEDASAGLLSCRLAIQSQEGSIAQPVDIQIEVAAVDGRRSVDIPMTLDLRSGLIEVHVTSPSGDKRIYMTKSRSCGTARRVLPKGAVSRRNYTLIGDADGVLFPSAGTYQLEAVLPTLGARSERVEFRVGPAVGVFGEADFQRFLAEDLPGDNERGWRAVLEVLGSRKVSALTKSFLRSKASARSRSPFMPMRMLRESASPRVQERDALLRVVRLRRAVTSQAKRLRLAIDDAEGVLRASDETNPSIQYLEHVRRSIQTRRRKEE